MPLVRAADSLLVIVDTQPGFVEHPAMRETERLAAAHTVERIAWLARVAGLLAVPIVVTEEAPDDEGETHARVKAFLPASASPIRKKSFALTGCREAIAAVRAAERGSVVVTGFETDVCVAQSAVGLKDAGYRVIVPADATYSARENDHRSGIARMR